MELRVILIGSMELLAALPAIIGLVGKGRELRNVTEKGDWIDFLLECLSNTSEDLKGRTTTSIGDFLRLYVSLNADEDGGVPGVHITQISGASYLDISQALSSGVLIYENEPITGTMSQYMEFQEKIKNALGTEPKEEMLQHFLLSFMEENKLIGHKETRFLDPRYVALLNHVKTYLPANKETQSKPLLLVRYSRSISFETSTTETNQVDHLTNSPPECTTNTPMYDSNIRLPRHSRILANLSSSVQRNYTTFSSLVNLPRLQNQTRTILSSTSNYNVYNQTMNNIIIDNQFAPCNHSHSHSHSHSRHHHHYHHHHHHNHHHHIKNDNPLNNMHEATNEMATERQNNINNGRVENGPERSPETVLLLRVLQKYFPYILILLVKGAYDQRLEIINITLLFVTFLYTNNNLKNEIAKQQNRSWFLLLLIMCFIAGCFFILNVIFDINVSTTQPLSLSELIWSVIATDIIIKLITIAFKVILTCLPLRLLACHKRGKYYVMLEATSQLCRRFAPIQPWIYYLNEAYQGSEKIVGFILIAIYTINKINDSTKSLKFFLTTLLGFIKNERLGSNPSEEQLINSGGICAICREEYKVPIILKCQHIFCEICVLTWLSTGKLCPMCRAPITDDAIYHNGHTTLYIQMY
ncbi:PREDICTED: RING finger and transmembrane domain-containing protein 2 isoform X2 [Polistes dominula]|uniref:RING finger and transmembrane domain-containing protein 2 isoform X2 n=1 Tax=Polistes dominula TaxID=743375 RepID=A0ABM1IW69_POLDO|nr:PREDICTED: RING finger and transmembrane domain-containing protein 2 isoform X2 [Polistes dominula]